MSAILDLEVWLRQAGVLDRHEARALHDAVTRMQTVAGYDCQGHRGSAPWLVRSPHAEHTLVLATPAHREVLLGMLRQRHGLHQAPCSKLAGWRLPAHVSTLHQAQPASRFRQPA